MTTTYAKRLFSKELARAEEQLAYAAKHGLSKSEIERWQALANRCRWELYYLEQEAK